MQERTNPFLKQASVIGAAMILTGIVALLIEFTPGAADAILKFWPTGIIGIGVALLFDNAEKE
jgi:energy-converting hydrogenase Eha subunit E